METSMRASGQMTRLMVRASTHILTGPHIAANGSGISSMAREKRCGRMVLVMRVSIELVKRTAKGISFGRMAPLTMVSFWTTIFMALASTNGEMAENTLATGRGTGCMVRAFLHGTTDVPMMVNMFTTRKMALARSSGQTADGTKANGRM